MSTASAINEHSIKLRPVAAEDAEALGRICFRAFKEISDAHNFPPDIPAEEMAVGLIGMLAGHPGVYGVAAEQHGRVVGSNFLWESDSVAGVGPITVDVEAQNSAIGRSLMDEVLRRAEEKGFVSVRLVQAAFHNRSLALYTKLGLNTVEPLSLMQGNVIGKKIAGYDVRKMEASDLDGADLVTRQVHGHTRRNEIAAAIEQGTAFVVEQNGRITGYSTVMGFFGHSAAESNADMRALISEAGAFHGPGFLLPTRNSELMRWCLENGLRIVQPMTLMSRGLYQEPRGAFLSSILF